MPYEALAQAIGPLAAGLAGGSRPLVRYRAGGTCPVPRFPVTLSAGLPSACVDCGELRQTFPMCCTHPGNLSLGSARGGTDAIHPYG